MMGQNTEISSLFSFEDNERQESLELARLGAALTKPNLLKPRSDDPDVELPQAYQSIGSNGLTSIASKMMLSVFPPDIPWVVLDLPSQIKFDPDVSDEDKQLLLDELFIIEVTALSTLEASTMIKRPGQQTYDFRTQQYRTMLQVIGTGDALQKLTPDYRIKLFGRDNYITRRDGAGGIMYHITEESIDPRSLTQEQLDAIELDISNMDSTKPADRLKLLHTQVEWDPVEKEWVTTQECNGHRLPMKNGDMEIREDISPYFSITFDLASDDNYGRGLPELNLGNLRSLNTFEERLLEILGLAAAARIVIGKGSSVVPEDLMADPGVPLENARVLGGVVQDIAWLGYNNTQSFSILTNGIDRKTQELARVFQVEGGTLPDRDRVTRAQIVRLGNEIDTALGGLYTFVAEGLQSPLMHRLLHQLRVDNLIKPFTFKHFDVVTTTGLTALSQQASFNRTLEFMQVIAQLGEDVRTRINMGVLVDVVARQQRITEPGLVKSDEEVAADQQQQLEQTARINATDKAIDVAGNTVEAAAQQQIQEQ